MTDGLLLRSALEYAARGWSVFPVYEFDAQTGFCTCADPFCTSPGKHPRVSGGVRSASGDRDQIREWWTRWPAANIAVACGELSNLLVIDLDVDDDTGKDGRESLREFLAVHALAVPPTLRSRTGGGGEHLFFQYPKGRPIKNLVGWLAGVDVRSNGGYVLLPPSTHESRSNYVWSSTDAVANLGPEIPEHLRRARSAPPRPVGADISVEPYDYQEAVAHGPRRGYRDHFFNSRAYGLRRSGLSHEKAVASMLKSYNAMPPDDKADFPWDVVADKIRRVWETVDPGEQFPNWDPMTAVATPVDPTTLPGYVPPDLDPDHIPETQTFSDLGNARRLVEGFYGRIMFSSATGWFVWSGTHWMHDTNGRILRGVQYVIEELHKQAMSMTDIDQQGNALAWVHKSRSKERIFAAAKLAEHQIEVQVAPDELDKNPHLLACANGKTVDLRTGEVRGSLPSDRVTQCSPVDYEADAESKLWQRFLVDATGGDRELETYLQRAAGYTMTADITEDVFFIVCGPPKTGKSTFLQAMLTILGGFGTSLEFDAVSGRSKDTMPPHEIARMLSRRMVAVSETPEGMRFNEAAVKKMSGGDRLVGCHKYRDPFEFNVTHKLWIATNHLPRINSEAMWRRLRPVPFSYPVANPDYRVRAEASNPRSEMAQAILAWAVQGAVIWHRDRLGMCQTVKQLLDSYKDDEDRLGQFIEEECILDPEARTATGDLYDRYVLWCSRNGERPGTKVLFSRKIAERGTFEKARDRQGRWGWRGMRLNGMLETPGVPNGQGGFLPQI